MGTGRKKIEMKKIENISNRRVTFCKRRQNLFKKATDLSALTGCKVAVLSLSSANNVFFHGDGELLETTAAEVLRNLSSGNLNALSDACFDVGKCCNEDDDMDELSGEDERTDDTLSVDHGIADNGGRCMDVSNVGDIKMPFKIEEQLAEAASTNDHNVCMDPFADNCGQGHFMDLFADNGGQGHSIDLFADNGGQGHFVDPFADNGGQGHIMNASSSDNMMKMIPWIDSDCTNEKLTYTGHELEELFSNAESTNGVVGVADNGGQSTNESTNDVSSFYNDNLIPQSQLGPCSLSANSECYFCYDPSFAEHKDMETVPFGRSRGRGASGLKVSDESMRTSEKEDLNRQLLLSRQRLEEFNEAMKMEYKSACEAPDIKCCEDIVFL